MKRTTNLRNQSTTQLNEQLKEINISLKRLKPFNLGLGAIPKEISKGLNKPPNTMYYSKLKKTKARILTILNERKTNGSSD